jgi:hypothetical protein
MIFYGGSAEIPGSEAKVNGILQTAAEKAPSSPENPCAVIDNP